MTRVEELRQKIVELRESGAEQVNKRDGVYYCDKRDTILIAIIEPRFLLQ